MRLADRLRRKGSWCGETHLQKATFLLQEMLQVRVGFDFIMWKHGPYSFGLHDELSTMRACSLIGLQIADPRYGPRLEVTASGRDYLRKHPKSVGASGKAVEYLAACIGTKWVVDLERLTTAYYVKVHEKPRPDVWVSLLRQLKPHIPEDKATQAVQEVEALEANMPSTA